MRKSRQLVPDLSYLNKIFCEAVLLFCNDILLPCVRISRSQGGHIVMWLSVLHHDVIVSARWPARGADWLEGFIVCIGGIMNPLPLVLSVSVHEIKFHRILMS